MKSWDNLTVKDYMPVVVGEQSVGGGKCGETLNGALSIEACESSKRSRGISALMVVVAGDTSLLLVK